MGDLKEHINKLINNISKTTELLYQQKADAFENVGGLVGKVEQICVELFAQKSAEGGIDFDQNELLKILSDVMSAMEQHDTIAMADVLEYDLKEFLGAFVEE